MKIKKHEAKGKCRARVAMEQIRKIQDKDPHSKELDAYLDHLSHISFLLVTFENPNTKSQGSIDVTTIIFHDMSGISIIQHTKPGETQLRFQIAAFVKSQAWVKGQQLDPLTDMVFPQGSFMAPGSMADN